MPVETTPSARAFAHLLLNTVLLGALTFLSILVGRKAIRWLREWERNGCVPRDTYTAGSRCPLAARIHLPDSEQIGQPRPERVARESLLGQLQQQRGQPCVGIRQAKRASVGAKLDGELQGNETHGTIHLF